MPEPNVADSNKTENEEKLIREIADLKRQLEEQKRAQHAAQDHTQARHPSRSTLWMIALVALVLIAVAFFMGYAPRQKRVETINSEASARQQALPAVTVTAAKPSPAKAELVLPGNVQAVTEAPILARSDGYVKKRYADIGDRVKAGQLLAEVEAPDLDQQVVQAQANLKQAEAAVEQAIASYQQGKANEQLAKVTATRWQHLTAHGAVSLQENDQYQAQYQAQTANVNALEKAVAAAKSNVASMQANLARLKELQGYEKVTAPFSGVITLRNIDVGALITANNTLLFRMAQTDRLRVYVNVPQANVSSIHVGQPAGLSVAERPGRRFNGTVTRTANSLDPSSRTLLAEVQLPNSDGTLFPGMYAQVDLNTTRVDPPLLIPGDSILVRNNGTVVAFVGSDQVIHLRKVTVGRDFGSALEILDGLEAGDQVVVNPTDVVREGVKVQPVLIDPAGKDAPK